MGMSKALMEKVAKAKSRTADPEKTTICCTRYGNVMASRGSVIPLFIDQIKGGKPLTVTNPEMTRFLMNLDEAVNLVLFAVENGKQGDLIIQKSPACTIEVLAKALKELFHAENKIQIIGTRHGEKLYETLLTKEEKSQSVDMGPYFCVPLDSRDLNYEEYFVEGISDIMKYEEYTSHNTMQLDIEETKKKLLTVDYIRTELKEWGNK
jgi:UDP-glucose 4-epimerase